MWLQKDSVGKLIQSNLNCDTSLKYLDDNNLLSSKQFEFRGDQSTVEQLLLTYNDITSVVNSGKTVDLMFFNYSKAFDTVGHARLLAKLRCIVIVGHVLT